MKKKRKKFLTRLCRFIYTKQIFILFETSSEDGIPEWLEGDTPDTLKPDIPIVIREGKEKDLDLLAGLADRKKMKLMREWFRQGHSLYLVFDGEKVAYYEWVAFKDYYNDFLRLTVPVKENEALAFDAYTHPDYKWKNILSSVSLEIVRDCYHKKNRDKIISCVREDKWPLFRRLYRITGLGNVRQRARIDRIRVMGIWTGRMKQV